MFEMGRAVEVHPFTGVSVIGHRKNGDPIWPVAGGSDDQTPDPSNSGIPLVQGGNPAWNDVLQHVPEDQRQEVVPKLQEWDKNFQQVQSSYAPWKDFAESGYKPEDVQLATNVMAMLEQNPRQVYEALGAHLGISTQEAQELVEDQGQQTQETEEEGSYEDPRVQKLEQQVNALSQIALSQREEEQVEQETQQLDNEFKELRTKYGDFDEREVLFRMQAGMDAEEAVNNYFEFVDNIHRQRRQAPRVLGSGGQVPQPQPDVTKLDSKDTKSLVAQMLKDANLSGE